MGKLFTMTLGIQLTVSNDILETHFSDHKEIDIAIPGPIAAMRPAGVRWPFPSIRR